MMQSPPYEPFHVYYRNPKAKERRKRKKKREEAIGKKQKHYSIDTLLHLW